MKHILRVHCSADYMEIDAAVVDVDEELLALIKGRRKMFDMVHGDDRDLYSMRFWCGVLDWFEDDEGELGMKLDSDDVIEAPEGFVPTELSRVEAVTMVVTDSGIQWTAFPKHCDDELRTSELRWDLLFPATTES